MLKTAERPAAQEKPAKKEEKKRLKAEGLEFPEGEPLPLSTDESLESPSAAGSE